MRSTELGAVSGGNGREPIRSRVGRPLGLAAVVITGALILVGCGASSDLRASASDKAGAQVGAVQQAGGAPVMVSCGEGQRAMVKQVAIDGQMVSQIDCVSAPAGQAAAQPVAPAAPAHYAVHYAPQGYQPAAYPVASAPVYSAPAPVPAVVRYEPRQQVRREVPQQKNRSWQKSALIIGSSAGVGAGVGGAVGGKKGALVGAAVGGGSATIWDQATRR
jgi:hypothetical protein